MLFLTILQSLGGVLIAAVMLLVAPLALVAPRLRGCRAEDVLSGACVVSITLWSCVMLLLHVTGTAIAQPILLGVAALVAVAAVAGGGLHAMVGWLHETDPRARWLLGVFVVLVLPFTNLAGIDTYKWQDLAGAIRVEGCVPWLVHPASLFGFTARSYPSVQPFLLATAEVGGRLGVDAGYFVVSVFCGVLGVAAAYGLGRTLFASQRHAAVLAAVYVLSPVFMRYAHWATGRGICLALLPLYIRLWLPAERTVAGVASAGPASAGCIRSAFRAGALRVLLAVLLAMSHKAGLVAAAVIPLAMFAGPLLPRARMVRMTLFAAALTAACCFAPRVCLPGPAGQVAGAARFAVTRFAWMLPAVAVALWWDERWSRDRRWRRLLPPLLATLLLAFHGTMYAAMLALPFVSLAAVAGVLQLDARYAGRARDGLAVAAALLLSLAAALAVVGTRSANAAPQAVRIAAAFLEHADPMGPYEVVAPGRMRPQIQAYVGGCPRFDVRAPLQSGLTIGRPPPLAGSPSQVARAWIAYVRNVFGVADVTISWYGEGARRYYVVVDGQGERPAQAVRVFRRGVVEVWSDRPLPAPAREEP